MGLRRLIPSVYPKNSYKYKSHTAITSIVYFGLGVDSAISTQKANSKIVDEFLGFCEASDADKTKVYQGSEPKRALRKQLAHTCKSLKSRHKMNLRRI